MHNMLNNLAILSTTVYLGTQQVCRLVSQGTEEIASSNSLYSNSNFIFNFVQMNKGN